MDIQIINTQTSEVGKFLEASCGKTCAYVWISKMSDTVNVCCKNASHRAFKGMGRTFRTIDEAIDAYKSPEMKAIISAAAAI